MGEYFDAHAHYPTERYLFMPILPQIQTVSYAGPLMLPAPKIAGLLGVGPQPNSSPARPQSETVHSPTELIYDDPRLAHLLPWAFADLRREVLMLLEATVSLLTGESDRQQFAEANVRFNGQMALLSKLLVPPDQQAPLPVAKTRAEMDEEMDAVRQRARQRLIDQYEETTRHQAARRAYWEGTVQP